LLETDLPATSGFRYSPSLERGLAILSCFSAEQPVLGVADVAEQLALTRSTAHRYLTTLHTLGYLQQGRARKYRLGLRVTELGMSALSSTELREHVQPSVEELREQSGYTVGVAVLDGPEIVYVERARGTRRAQRDRDRQLRPGSRMPAYCTAMGKILLAHLPGWVQRELLGEIELEANSSHTITSKRKLRDALTQVANEGLAVNGEEFKPGVQAIAVPLRDESNEVVAAIGMSANADAMSLQDMIGALRPHLVSAASRISARLGYRRGYER
jgi:IclR family transcriptional regulator, pca regulon regulatory protein